MTTCARCGGSGEEPGSTHRPPRWPDGNEIDVFNDPRWKRFNYMNSLNQPVLYPEPEPPRLRLTPGTARVEEEGN